MWGIDLVCCGATGILEELLNLKEGFNVQDVLDIPGSEKLVASLIAEWEEKEAERAVGKNEQLARKLENRTKYGQSLQITITVRDGNRIHYHFEQGMDAQGLMEEYLRHNKVPVDGPVIINLLNNLPIQDDGNPLPIPESEALELWNHGYLLCGGQTLWRRDVAELWNIFPKMFPTAIDFASYHRGLRAPLVPGGFLPELRVRVHNVHSHGNPQGVDGSGLYDPSHPDMADLVARYGAVGFQFRAFTEDGHFFKGMLFPREGINNDLPEEERVGIHLDHLQVKGTFKKLHKSLNKASGSQAVMISGVYVGIMKAKTTIGRVRGCFETIQVIGPDPAVKTGMEFLHSQALVAKTIRNLTQKSINDLGEKGPEALVLSACKNDQYLSRLVEFIVMANKNGAGIDLLSIPLVINKTENSLSRRLWGPAQGAGITGKYPVVCIDNSLKPGTCVLGGFKPGTELAVFRYPTILAQGLRVLKVVHGYPQHKVAGKLIPNVIFMNAFDITTCQQGDDDGDEVGVTSDPQIVELFKHRKDNRIYHIEPVGEKFDYATDSDEGRRYIQSDPMGPVGLITIQHASLIACGDVDYERAFAVLIQEAIDSQKNWVRMTDPYKAAKLENWHKDANGEYHIHYKDPETGEWLTDNWVHETAQGFDVDIAIKCFAQRMDYHGCVQRFTDRNGTPVEYVTSPLGWKTQKSSSGDVIKKRIAVNNWQGWRSKQKTGHANWVHMAHDVAKEAWEEWRKKFEPSGSMITKNVLTKLLAELGHAVEPIPLDWETYNKTLRKQAGLNDFAKSMRTIMSEGYQSDEDPNPGVEVRENDSQRMSRIESAKSELDLCLSRLSVQELYTIWCMELTETWKYVPANKRPVFVNSESEIPTGVRGWQVNKPNYAIHAVTCKHSAIMRLLGFTATEACKYMEVPGRLSERVAWCRRTANPFEAIVHLIQNEKGHAQSCKDENGEGIPLSACPECIEKLKTELVRQIRADKSAKEIAGAKRLVSALNATRHIIEWLPAFSANANPVKDTESFVEEYDYSDMYYEL